MHPDRTRPDPAPSEAMRGGHAAAPIATIGGGGRFAAVA